MDLGEVVRILPKRIGIAHVFRYISVPLMRATSDAIEGNGFEMSFSLINFHD